MLDWRQHRSGVTPVTRIHAGQTAMWGLSVVRLRLAAPAAQGVLPRLWWAGWRERLGFVSGPDDTCKQLAGSRPAVSRCLMARADQ